MLRSEHGAAFLIYTVLQTHLNKYAYQRKQNLSEKISGQCTFDADFICVMNKGKSMQARMPVLLTPSPQKSNSDLNESQISTVTNLTEPSLNLSAYIDAHSVTSLAF